MSVQAWFSAACSVYSWGWGVYGQLGHGSAEDELIPRHIHSLDGADVVSVAAGHAHSLVLTAQVCIRLISLSLGNLHMRLLNENSSSVVFDIFSSFRKHSFYNFTSILIEFPFDIRIATQFYKVYHQ